MTAVFIDHAPQLKPCVQVLAGAFSVEPTILRLCGSDHQRHKLWFSALLSTHSTVAGHRLLVTQNGHPVAAAIATAPGAKPGISAQAAWTMRTLRDCGPTALLGTLTYLRETEQWKPPDAWTLEFIGVLPEARGQGLARQLCELVQAEYPGSPAFLTTADPRNVASYEKWGFETTVELPLLRLPVVGMRRPNIAGPATAT